MTVAVDVDDLASLRFDGRPRVDPCVVVTTIVAAREAVTVGVLVAALDQIAVVVDAVAAHLTPSRVHVRIRVVAIGRAVPAVAVGVAWINSATVLVDPVANDLGCERMSIRIGVVAIGGRGESIAIYVRRT